LNVLSLYSGIGGLDLGLERAGMTTVGQVEKDPACLRILGKHWPEVPKHDDVATAADWWLESGDRPPVDMVAGGFPCQGHSNAGHRRGTDDPRWGWPAFRATVAALQPAYIFIENVPGLLRTGFNVVLQDLADDGWDAWWSRVPAAALGAPHLRWRLFCVAAFPGRAVLRNEQGWARWRGGQGSIVTGVDGSSWALADPISELRGPRWVEGSNESSWVRSPRSNWWTTEPNVGRVANGVSGRVARLRMLGNACVPIVAEYVGRLIMAGVEQ
jgi:DNA (cytosine-5)-methyltransferase 1